MPKPWQSGLVIPLFSAKILKMPEAKKLEPKRLNFIYRWLLKGRMDYYANMLEPREKSLLIRFFFQRFQMGRIPEPTRKRIEELWAKGRVVFALKDRSRLDFIFLHYLFAENGMAAPMISADLPIWIFFKIPKAVRSLSAWLLARLNCWADFRENYWQEVRQQVDEGNGMLTYLINPGMVAKRYLHPEEDSFFNLLKWQVESEQDYLIVPLVVVWSRAPERAERGLVDIVFGTVNNPGPLRRLYNYIYLILVEEALVEAADPVNLRQFIAKDENRGLNRALLAHRLREHLMGHFEREKRVIIGPVLKSRSQLMEEVLQDELLNQRLEEIAREQNQDLMAVKREAASYLDEMASNYNQRMVDFLDLVLDWVWKNLFSGMEVDETGFEKIRNIAKRYPIVYVPSHKSHIDYLVLSYVLYHKNFFPPHIVAGINLSFFPLGPVFRGTGAFFMRRTFKGNKVYALVFSNYLKVLLKEDYPIEFFIEGGRSRTGRLLLPKMGIVKYLVRAYHELGLKDLQFVPVYIGYDQVIEQAGYLREIKGETKRESRLRTLPRWQRLITDQYGKIYLSFGEPIGLKKYLEENVEQAGEESDAGYENLGYALVREINRLTLVTPGAIVACALLASAKPARKLEELQKAWSAYLNYLRERKARLSKGFEDNRDWHEEALEFYQSKKLVEFLPDQESLRQIVSVLPNSRLNLEFYKNNIIHFLVPAAMAGLLKLKQKSGQEMLGDYKRLKQLFRFDFVFSGEADDEAELNQALAFFQTENGDEAFKNFAGLMANFLESYAIALRTLRALTSTVISEKDFLARAQRRGAQELTLREIERPEAVSKLNFENALSWMKAEKWLTSQGANLELSAEAGPQAEAEQELSWIDSLLAEVKHF